MKILCIIPIFNEKARINELIKNIIKFIELDKYKIDFLLIDNGSNDGTSEILKKSKLNVITLRRNKGVGYSLLLGLKISNKKKYDILVHMAGNNKMKPIDIHFLIKPLIEKDYDFVSGSRFLMKDNYSTNPIFRKISISLLSKIFSYLFRKKITDATCGFRAFKIKKIIKFFYLFNKKKFYTYGYEYYSYGKVLLSKSIKSCEESVEMKYPKKGKYSKIRPIIDWYPIINGYLESLTDKIKID